MSDQIKHECGIALIRLLKPLGFYIEKYGTPLYGLNKLYLLMEKQHNRGQDGAGVANIKLDVEPGKRYISRYRSISSNPIQDIFGRINEKFAQVSPKLLKDAKWLKNNVAFTGELLLGHLRYGTYGKNSIEYCHPFLRQNNWMSRNLVLAGNFNLTNMDELFGLLIDIGQHPKEKSDAVTILEKIGHFLDEENEKLYREYKSAQPHPGPPHREGAPARRNPNLTPAPSQREGESVSTVRLNAQAEADSTEAQHSKPSISQGYTNKEISALIAKNLNVQNILKESCIDWDGGYVIAGLIGNGDAFVVRDPSGIRPAYYYQDDEVVVVTSERPPIQTAFNVPFESIREIKPGHALVIKKDGNTGEYQVKEQLERKSCSFERIYFSRGNDIDIYKERKKLGQSICPAVLDAIEYDVKNTVFSFIPNTAEVAFYGMIEGIEAYLNDVKERKISDLGPNPDKDKLKEILSIRPRFEKIAIKDTKIRTFITDDAHRDEMVTHIYDITYGTVKEGVDTLVVIDDSIVRGTTLKQSILAILDRLNPKKIIIVSSAPQIRYPDCYGIDMAKLGDFIAFRAAIALLKETYQENIIDDVYEKSKAQEGLPKENIKNYVKEIYKPFTAEQVSEKITELLKPGDINAEVQIIYQSLEGLHEACPNHKGDWYFSGNYPTPGGNRVVNKAYINFIEGKNVRAY